MTFTPANFGTNIPGLSGLTATGTTQADAYLLAEQMNVFSTVPAGSGVVLPSSYASGTFPWVFNRGVNALLVYPAKGDEIENNGINVPVTIPAGGNFAFVSFAEPLAASPRVWWQTTLYANGAFVPTTGGTMTGELIINNVSGTSLDARHDVLVGGTLGVTGASTLAALAASGAVTATGAGTGLAVTNNATVGGTVTLGTGTLSGSPYAFQAAYNADPSTGATDTRQSMFNTTLSYATTSTHIWENLNSFLYVNGPGIASGEINLAHTYLQVNAGGNAAVSEGYESSMLNNGTIGQFTGYLGIATNGTAGVASYINGAVFYLTNNNTAAASIGEWNAISIGAMQGGGSRPTYYNAMKVADANAGIVTLGGINVGSIANATPGQILAQGADNSAATYPLIVKNLAGNVFGVNDGGITKFFAAGVDINPSASGPNLFIQGSDNSTGTFPVSVKNLAGTSMLLVNNAGTLATPQVVVNYVDVSTSNALTAAGTTRTDALALASQNNRITTAAAGTGVVLQTAVSVGTGCAILIFNDGANPIKVYAQGTETIDGVAGATGVTLTNGKRCLFYVFAVGVWVSAQLGVPSA